MGYSFHNELLTFNAKMGCALIVYDALKDYYPDARIYSTATSELFEKPREAPQNEFTPLFPRSPYAVSKLADIWAVITYREAYKLFMANGIPFYNAFKVRGTEFVIRKISRSVAMIYHDSKRPVVLGNLSVAKDWGYAID